MFSKESDPEIFISGTDGSVPTKNESDFIVGLDPDAGFCERSDPVITEESDHSLLRVRIRR